MNGEQALVTNPVMVDAAGALKVELGWLTACGLLLIWIILDTADLSKSAEHIAALKPEDRLLFHCGHNSDNY